MSQWFELDTMVNHQVDDVSVEYFMMIRKKEGRGVYMSYWPSNSSSGRGSSIPPNSSGGISSGIICPSPSKN